MTNQLTYTSNISILIKELELAVFTSQLTRIQRNKIVLRLLRLQYEITL
jgi:hypothetical protein